MAHLGLVCFRFVFFWDSLELVGMTDPIEETSALTRASDQLASKRREASRSLLDCET